MSYDERDRRNRLVTCVEQTEKAIRLLEDLRAELKAVTDTRPDYLGAAADAGAVSVEVGLRLSEVKQALEEEKW